MGSQRTIITLSSEDKQWLESYSRSIGISMAEAIRRGIGRLKEEEGKNTYEMLVKTSTGLWKKGNGLTYQKKMRSEWR